MVKPSIQFIHILAKFYGETSVKAKMNSVVEDLTHQQKTGQSFPIIVGKII